MIIIVLQTKTYNLTKDVDFEKIIYIFAALSTKNKFFCIMSEYLSADKKQEIFGKYGKSNTDTGSAESQIALFSYRISHLTEHLKVNRKDYSTARALTQLVAKRRALLNYLYDNDITRYRAIIKAFNLRKYSQ